MPSSQNTFVAPKPKAWLIKALIPINRLVNLKGIPLLRDIPYLNQLPIVRGLCDIRRIDLDDQSQLLLQNSMAQGQACFVTPNHPEFFTDWMLDKELASRFAPMTANWATSKIVNGMGKRWQSFWLANHLIAQVQGDTEAALQYSKQTAAKGTPVLLHPEGTVWWQSDYINPLFHGAAQMALELAQERPELKVVIQPVVWKLRFNDNASDALQKELDYVAKELGVDNTYHLALPLRVAKLHREALKQTFTYLGYIAPKGLNYFDLRDALLMRINQDLQTRYPTDASALSSEQFSEALLKNIRQHEKSGQMLESMTLRKRKILQRLLRTPKTAYMQERWSQENLAECVKRLRNDYLHHGWRNQIHQFVPRPVAGRTAYIRACDTIDVRQWQMQNPSGSADDLMAEIRKIMQNKLNKLVENHPSCHTYSNAFLL